MSFVVWGHLLPAHALENEFTEPAGATSAIDQWITSRYFESNCPRSIGKTGERPNDGFISDTLDCSLDVEKLRTRVRKQRDSLNNLVDDVGLSDTEVGEWLWVSDACENRQVDLSRRIREIQGITLALSQLPLGSRPAESARPADLELARTFDDLTLLNQLDQRDAELVKSVHDPILGQNWAADYDQKDLIRKCDAEPRASGANKEHPLVRCYAFWKSEPRLAKRINWQALDAKRAYTLGRQTIQTMRQTIFNRRPILASPEFRDLIRKRGQDISEKSFNIQTRKELLTSYNRVANQADQIVSTCEAIQKDPSKSLKPALYNTTFLADLVINAAPNEVSGRSAHLQGPFCRIQNRLLGREAVSQFKREVREGISMSVQVALVIATDGAFAGALAGELTAAQAFRVASLASTDISMQVERLNAQKEECRIQGANALIGKGSGSALHSCTEKISEANLQVGMSVLAALGLTRGLSVAVREGRLVRAANLQAALAEGVQLDRQAAAQMAKAAEAAEAAKAAEARKVAATAELEGTGKIAPQLEGTGKIAPQLEGTGKIAPADNAILQSERALAEQTQSLPRSGGASQLSAYEKSNFNDQLNHWDWNQRRGPATPGVPGFRIGSEMEFDDLARKVAELSSPLEARTTDRLRKILSLNAGDTIEFLGSGGLRHVFKVESGGKKYVIKVPRYSNSLAFNDRSLENVLGEAQTLATREALVTEALQNHGLPSVKVSQPPGVAKVLGITQSEFIEAPEALKRLEIATLQDYVNYLERKGVKPDFLKPLDDLEREIHRAVEDLEMLKEGRLNANDAALVSKEKWKDLFDIQDRTFTSSTSLGKSDDAVGIVANRVLPDPTQQGKWVDRRKFPLVDFGKKGDNLLPRQLKGLSEAECRSVKSGGILSVLRVFDFGMCIEWVFADP